MDLVFVTLLSASLVTLALWLCRNLILTRLSNAVKHEYDEKLEHVKTKLMARQSEIEALRTFALSGATARQIELCQRQVAAVEQLWGVVLELTPAKKAVNFMSIIDFNKAVKVVKTAPDKRKVFTTILSEFDHKLENTKAAQCRPFVSPLAWALFSAYIAILQNDIVRLKILEEGKSDGYINCDLEKIIKLALPHRAAPVPTNCFNEILEELESALLLELKSILDGERSDHKNLERAALILSEAERLGDSVAQHKLGNP
jgi:hypothetical protein